MDCRGRLEFVLKRSLTRKNINCVREIFIIVSVRNVLPTTDLIYAIPIYTGLLDLEWDTVKCPGILDFHRLTECQTFRALFLDSPLWIYPCLMIVCRKHHAVNITLCITSANSAITTQCIAYQYRRVNSFRALELAEDPHAMDSHVKFLGKTLTDILTSPSVA